jgi:hypothetical protein
MPAQRHLVITVHGVQTFGKWQKRLESLLHGAAPGIEVFHYPSGFLAPVLIVVPITRWVEVRRFRKWLLDTLEGNPATRIDIVAHSFGTHLVAWALHSIASQKRPQIHTILFASTILRPRFPWQRLIGEKTIRRIINECAWKDKALLLFQWIPFFLLRPGGLAGRYGFKGSPPRLVDRYFLFGHSGYFYARGQPDDSFMTRRWLPLLLTDDPVERVDERPDSPGLLGGLWISLVNNWHFVNIAVFAGLRLAWVLWARSDRYQVKSILANAPVREAAAGLATESLTAWAKALTTAGHHEAAATACNLAADTLRGRSRDPLDALLSQLEVTLAAGRPGTPRKYYADLHDALFAPSQVGCTWGYAALGEQYNRAIDCSLFLALAGRLNRLPSTPEFEPLREDAEALLHNAHEAVQGVQLPDLRSQVLLLFAAELVRERRVTEATKAVQEAVQSVPTIADRTHRAWRQLEAVRILNSLRTFHQALLLARSIQDTEIRADALIEVASAAVLIPDSVVVKDALVEAVFLVQSVVSYSSRDSLRVGLSRVLAHAGQLAEARKVALLITDSHYRAGAFVTLAGAYAAQAQQTDATISLELARTAALRIRNSFFRFSALLPVATTLGAAGRRGDALEVFAAAQNAAERIDGFGRNDALAAVAEGLARAGYFTEAQRFVLNIDAEEGRSHAAEVVAQEAVRRHQYRYARLLAEQSRAPAKLVVYAAILSNYVERGKSAPRVSGVGHSSEP